MSTVRATTRPTPTHPLTAEELTSILAALPPLLARAPPDLHPARRKQITREIAWHHSADAPQAQLIVQIVLPRRLADNTMGRSRAHTNSPQRAHRLACSATRLMRPGARLEHALRRQQKRAMPPASARPTEPPLPRNAPARSDAVHPEPPRNHTPAPAPAAPPPATGPAA